MKSRRPRLAGARHLHLVPEVVVVAPAADDPQARAAVIAVLGEILERHEMGRKR